MTRNFFKRDNKGKIRIVTLQLNFINPTYTITGETGLLTGKKISRPIITVDKGKVKRSILEQATLQYNSICSGYLDKGYKEDTELGITDLTNLSDIETKVPTSLTDQQGNLKPMLAKSSDGLNTEIFNKIWYASAKLDGVRALMYWNPETFQVYTSSRGGMNYDIPSTYIRESQPLMEFFQLHPKIVLDGELYIHGMPLAYISGIVRLKDLCDKHQALQYHVYDIVEESLTFSERLKILEELKQFLETYPNYDKVIVLSHVQVSGYNNIIQLHNKFVHDGYEGLVIRDPNQFYKCGARDNRMLKVKKFQDSEFEILGLVEGLRDEDLCFLLKTADGNQFKAKPIGDRNLKQWYREHIDNLIGKMGTVKFFGYTTTENPVPFLPVFKSVRTKEDL